MVEIDRHSKKDKLVEMIELNKFRMDIDHNKVMGVWRKVAKVIDV